MSLGKPDVRDRFVKAVREAVRSGDRERFEELMAWAADQQVPAPSPLELREKREERREGRRRRVNWPPEEDICDNCGAWRLADAPCSYCRRKRLIEDRHEEA